MIDLDLPNEYETNVKNLGTERVTTRPRCAFPLPGNFRRCTHRVHSQETFY